MGVVDDGVGVAVLLAGDREQPVQLALTSFVGEELPHVVAREAPAEGERVGLEAAGAALDDGHEAHVERRLALPLDRAVLEAGAVLEDDLRDRVGEVRGAGDPRVALHDLDLAAAAGDHDRAGMADRGRGPRSPGRHEDEVDGLVHRQAGRDEDECPVLEERRVEVGEGGRLIAHDAAEMRSQPLRLPREHVGQAADLQAALRRDRRQSRSEAAVDEDDLVALERALEAEGGHVRRPHPRSLAGRRAPEGGARDGSDAREAPLLLGHGREAAVLEAGDGLFALLAKPRRLGGGSAGGEGLELGPVPVGLRHRLSRKPLRRAPLIHGAGRCHGAAEASSHS